MNPIKNRNALLLLILPGLACVSPYFTHIDIMDATWFEDRDDLKRHIKYEPEMIDGMTESSHNFAPVHAAAMLGDLPMIKLLVRNGARTRIWGSGGVYPIHVAAQAGHQHVVRYFLNHGFDVNEGGAEGAPLHYAIQGGHDDLVRYLLDRGADIQQTVFNAPTPLHVAARTGQPTLVRLLLDRGADAQAMDVRDRTPYMLALVSGKFHTASVLKETTDRMASAMSIAP